MATGEGERGDDSGKRGDDLGVNDGLENLQQVGIRGSQILFFTNKYLPALSMVALTWCASAMPIR